MHAARESLLSTLAHKSFRLGEFKLSSGGTSDYYIDCRATTLDAKGRANVEKAAAPAPFISIFTANDVRQQHLLQNDDTQPIFAVALACEVCGRPAVTNNPRNRCEAHKL